MIEMEKNDEISNVPAHHHSEFIEKKKPLLSLKWLGDLLDLLSDFFVK
jgi:hypothetical protein